MDYSKHSLNELERMLDSVVRDYANGDMHHSHYTVQFNELYEAIEIKKHPQHTQKSQERAYERAMRGI